MGEIILRELDLEIENAINLFDVKINNLREEYNNELEKIQIKRGEILGDEKNYCIFASEIDDLELCQSSIKGSWQY